MGERSFLVSQAMLQNSVQTNKLMSKTPKNRNNRIKTAATATF